MLIVPLAPPVNIIPDLNVMKKQCGLPSLEYYLIYGTSMPQAFVVQS